jgi:hypothetical protein
VAAVARACAKEPGERHPCAGALRPTSPARSARRSCSRPTRPSPSPRSPRRRRPCRTRRARRHPRFAPRARRAVARARPRRPERGHAPRRARPRFHRARRGSPLALRPSKGAAWLARVRSSRGLRPRRGDRARGRARGGREPRQVRRRGAHALAGHAVEALALVDRALADRPEDAGLLVLRARAPHRRRGGGARRLLRGGSARGPLDDAARADLAETLAAERTPRTARTGSCSRRATRPSPRSCAPPARGRPRSGCGRSGSRGTSASRSSSIGLPRTARSSTRLTATSGAQPRSGSERSATRRRFPRCGGPLAPSPRRRASSA